jgi:uncharacterized protein (TIGR02757 family)
MAWKIFSRNLYFCPMLKDFEYIRIFLEEKSGFYNSPSFITLDPISVPHRFQKKEDIEIAGFLAATLAWGQRPQIIAKSLSLISLMDNEPSSFILLANEKEFERFRHFVYRTFNSNDLLWFIHALRSVLTEYGTLENIFAEGYRKNQSIKEAIIHARNCFLRTHHLTRSEKHFADPANNSAAKRINLFLRWMVRSDEKGVDFGIWKSINQAHLMCPLDVHSGHVAREMGLLQRKQNDWKAVEELTANLRQYDPYDPVKYDFALFGNGVNEKTNL